MLKKYPNLKLHQEHAASDCPRLHCLQTSKCLMVHITRAHERGGWVSVSETPCPGQAHSGCDCVSGEGWGFAKPTLITTPRPWQGGQALPCDPPEGDPGKKGGAGFRARVLVERKRGWGGKEKGMIQILVYTRAQQGALSTRLYLPKDQQPLSRHGAALRKDLPPEPWWP